MLQREPVVIRIPVKPDGTIDRSPEKDPDVVIQPGDRVTWICPEADFKVYETVQSGCPLGSQCPHSEGPFGARMARPDDYVPAGGSFTSPPAVPGAKAHVYKTNWEVMTPQGVPDVYDPHIIVK